MNRKNRSAKSDSTHPASPTSADPDPDSKSPSRSGDPEGLDDDGEDEDEDEDEDKGEPDEDDESDEEDDSDDDEDDSDDDEDDSDDDEDDSDDDEDDEDAPDDEEDDSDDEDDSDLARPLPSHPLLARLTRVTRAIDHLARQWPTPAFVLSFLFLSAMVTIRYPQEPPSLWYLVPSIDITILLGLFVVLRLLRWRIGVKVRVALVALLFLVRFIRLGDGVRQRYFAQAFNLYTDVRIFPELVRFVYSSVGFFVFVLIVVGVVLACGLFAAASYAALVHCQRYLRNNRHLMLGGSFVGAAFGLAFLQTTGDFGQKDAATSEGGFTASAAKRLLDEVTFLTNVLSGSTPFARQSAAAQRRLASVPSNLAKLNGANVHLILVESYGQAVFDWAPHIQASQRFFEDFERALKARGFSIVSGVLDSPTYGGQSWLAHSTLATGIRIENQLEYQVTIAKKAKALPDFFHKAGYRTVLVEPNTTRSGPAGEFYEFDRKYYNQDLGYKGPAFAWATMPDQYVLDFVRRHELANITRPLFIEYVLISSHAPWNRLPQIVNDWDGLGDGSLFNHLETIRFPIEWPYFANAQEAYIRSIIYDFTLLQHYLTTYVDDGALIVILGDHQPVSDLTGWSPSRGVPMHVLSKNPKLLEPFLALGYRPGIRPISSPPLAGMETFAGNFVAGYSTH